MKSQYALRSLMVSAAKVNMTTAVFFGGREYVRNSSHRSDSKKLLREILTDQPELRQYVF